MASLSRNAVPAAVLGKVAERFAVSRDAPGFELAFENIKQTMES